MNLMPEDKIKAAIYGGIAAVILILALYFAFFRGGTEPVPTELQDRASEIAEGMQAPQPTIPEIPPEQRPQRGPPALPK